MLFRKGAHRLRQVYLILTRSVVETSRASCAANLEIYSLLALLFLLFPKKARYATTFLGVLRRTHSHKIKYTRPRLCEDFHFTEWLSCARGAGSRLIIVFGKNNNQSRLAEGL